TDSTQTWLYSSQRIGISTPLSSLLTLPAASPAIPITFSPATDDRAAAPGTDPAESSKTSRPARDQTASPSSGESPPAPPPAAAPCDKFDTLSSHPSNPPGRHSGLSADYNPRPVLSDTPCHQRPRGDN